MPYSAGMCPYVCRYSPYMCPYMCPCMCPYITLVCRCFAGEMLKFLPPSPEEFAAYNAVCLHLGVLVRVLTCVLISVLTCVLICVLTCVLICVLTCVLNEEFPASNEETNMVWSRKNVCVCMCVCNM